MRRNRCWPIMLGLWLVAAWPWSAALPDNAAEPDRPAKLYAPSTGKAAIYVYRLNGWRGSGGTYPVTVDGNLAGKIVNGTFYRLEVDPGEHEVFVGWTRTMKRGPGDPIHPTVILIPVSAQAGQSYFIRVANQGHKHVAVGAGQAKAELQACCTLAEQDRTDAPLFH